MRQLFPGNLHTEYFSCGQTQVFPVRSCGLGDICQVHSVSAPGPCLSSVRMESWLIPLGSEAGPVPALRQKAGEGSVWQDTGATSVSSETRWSQTPCSVPLRRLLADRLHAGS